MRKGNVNYQREKENRQETEIRRNEKKMRCEQETRLGEDSRRIQSGFPRKRNCPRMSSPYQFLEGQTAESLTGCIFQN